MKNQSQTLSFQAKDVTNIESDSVGIDAQSDCAIQAGNQILHQVGDTQIIAKGDSVIIKAGGVEVVIDSNGLVVKGGEVKAEWKIKKWIKALLSYSLMVAKQDKG